MPGGKRHGPVRRTPRGPITRAERFALAYTPPTKKIGTERKPVLQCHCQACTQGQVHFTAWQDQRSEARETITAFLNIAAQHSRQSKVGVHTRLDTVGVISWLRETLDWNLPKS